MTALLEAHGLSRRFTLGRRHPFDRLRVVSAVEDASLTLAAGETLGLVGESGSGKSTLGRMAAGLMTPSAGRISIDGQDPAHLTAAGRKALARQVQIVFQDTLGALNPRLTIGRQLREPFDIHGIGTPAERLVKVAGLLEDVGLEAALAGRFAHELSGGQRQRVVVARAMALKPALLVCDEPVSALDVSVQAQVLAVLHGLRGRGLACLFISHDLRVVRQVSDRVAVMYLGRIIEQASVEDLFARPVHPYTRALLDSVPVSTPGQRRPRSVLQGEPPSPIDPPQGCRFHPRCAWCLPRCRSEVPALSEIAPGHAVACHRASERLAA
jgi:peptide/nickel transport system ATP-binding protein